MAEVRPFRGLRYGPSVDLQAVVAPPYDVLDAGQAAELRRRSPLNAVHVDLPVAPGEEGDDAAYARAAAALARWRAEGALLQDAAPTIYVLDQRYRGPDGQERTRRGFIARLALAPLDAGVVRPHERTHAGPKVDRLRLYRATHADTSPIFLLHPDDDGAVVATLAAALADADPAATRSLRDDDGNVHALTPVRGDDAARIAALLRGRPVYIADGHHRYETALAYREERRAAGDAGADFLMVYLCSMSDPGLAVFPAHRLLKGVEVPPLATALERLESAFAVTAAGGPELCERLVRDLPEAPDPRETFVLCFTREQACRTVALRDPAALARLGDEGLSADAARLSVNILQYVILRDALGIDPARLEGHVHYVTSAAEACARLAGEDYVLGAFLNGTGVDDVRAVADRGETLPQKSTYFYPKLLAGLVYDALGD